MKKYLFAAVLSSIVLFSFKEFKISVAPSAHTEKEHENPAEPNEWFFTQRSSPGQNFDYIAFEKAMNQVQASIYQRGGAPTGSSEPWLLEGPTNIGGRITCIAIHPIDHNIIYVGCPNGGMYRTIDGGKNWKQLFDLESNLSIASITIDKNNPSNVWAGTGDPDIRRYPMPGDGLYKSTNGGNTWKYMGLKDGRIITKIELDPTDSNIIYASAMGLPTQRSKDRGLYKSTDGGSTWNQILFLKNDAGVNDFILDKLDNKHLIAAGWNRIFSNQENINGGSESRLYQSFDAGKTWTPIIFNNQFDYYKYSRIGLYQHPKYPKIILSLMIDNFSFEIKGLLKSGDGGITFYNIISNSGSALLNICNGSGWYFARTIMDPIDTNEIYVGALDLYRTTDGGASWNMCAPPWYTYEVHADKHAYAMLGSDTMFITTDGGLYKTSDNCNTWKAAAELPNTQFYRVAIDPFHQGIYSGGAQDNGTCDGSRASLNNWTRQYGGDGFQTLFHPTDTNIRYYETQWGNVDGIANGNVQSMSNRVNWDMPLLMSRFNPNIIYAASEQVLRNENGYGGFFHGISNDLTDGNIYGNLFHNISALCESNLNKDILFAGTSDGNLWRSYNYGSQWTRCDTTLPNQYITSIKTSYINSGKIYMSNSGYKMNDYIPHIHISNDTGKTWNDISSNLPQIAINDICPDPYSDSVLYIATDAGIYITLDSAKNWYRLGTNMPVFPVYDIEIDTTLKRLIAGTYARGMMSYPLDSIFKYQVQHNIGISSFTKNDIYIFPNPTADEIYLQNAEKGNYVLYNISGAIVKQGYINNASFKISVADFSSGLYFLEVLKNNARVKIEKIICK